MEIVKSELNQNLYLIIKAVENVLKTFKSGELKQILNRNVRKSD